MLAKQGFTGNQRVLTENLEALLPQKPNKRLFGIPGATVSLWIYQARLPRYAQKRVQWQVELDTLTQRFETNSIAAANSPRLQQRLRQKYNRKAEKLRNRIDNGTWVMRTIGEPPVYFNETDARRNALKIKNYLVNQGYRNAQVGFVMDTVLNSNRVRITYNINEGTPFRLRNVQLLTGEDPVIDTLLKHTESASNLKAGELFKYENIVAETIRIEQLMRNSGYYGFSRQSLLPLQSATGKRRGGFLVDTTVRVPATDTLFRSIDIKKLEVNYPRRQAGFLSYQFGTVGFSVENEGLVQANSRRDTITYRGINYWFGDRRYSTKVLDTKLLVRPNTVFKQNDLDETYRQLSLLDQFKFINVETDTSRQRANTLIRVIPLDRFQVSTEGGLNLVQNLPGPFANGTFRARNVFGGLENFEFSIRGAVDFQSGLATNPQDFTTTTELGGNLSLIFPRILFPGKFVSLLNRKAPRTLLSLGYNYSNRLPNFRRSGFRASMTYSWNKSQYEFFNVSVLDINFLRTERSAEFDQFLADRAAEGNPLINSFQDQSFVSSISASYIYNDNIIGQNRRSNYRRLFVESGGTMLNLVNNLLPENYARYKFLKINAEYRSYRPLGKYSTLVFRANAGVLFSYGQNRVPPYEKYFTGGGSNGMRAWPPRRLGLGAGYPRAQARIVNGQVVSLPYFSDTFRDTITVPVANDPNARFGRYDNRFEQLGDVILESNLELRGRLFRFVGDVNYALFLDVGNVWRIPRPTDFKGDANLQNQLFSSNFHQQFAVGTGVGLRYDFSYFIIRFDLGIKVYDPSRKFSIINEAGSIIAERDERYLLPYFSFRRDSPNYPVFNIGIGYPF